MVISFQLLRDGVSLRLKLALAYSHLLQPGQHETNAGTKQEIGVE